MKYQVPTLFFSLLEHKENNIFDLMPTDGFVRLNIIEKVSLLVAMLLGLIFNNITSTWFTKTMNEIQILTDSLKRMSRMRWKEREKEESTTIGGNLLCFGWIRQICAQKWKTKRPKNWVYIDVILYAFKWSICASKSEFDAVENVVEKINFNLLDQTVARCSWRISNESNYVRADRLKFKYNYNKIHTRNLSKKSRTPNPMFYSNKFFLIKIMDLWTAIAQIMYKGKESSYNLNNVFWNHFATQMIATTCILLADP